MSDMRMVVLPLLPPVSQPSSMGVPQRCPEVFHRAVDARNVSGIHHACEWHPKVVDEQTLIRDIRQCLMEGGRERTGSPPLSLLVPWAQQRVANPATAASHAG
jgi:hypothetical protein